MRIMHISTRLILGGSQENTVLSCEGQVRRGHAVSLVYGPIYGPEGSMLERVQAFRSPTGERIENIETPNLTRELAPFRDPKCRRELRTLIRSWKPDVVHTHSSKAGILGRLAAWKEKIPCVVHTVHGPPFHAYEKKWRNAIYKFAERSAAKNCHKIICVADAMRQQFLAARIGKPEQYEIVYSGMEIAGYLSPASIDLTWTRENVRRELGFSPDDFVLGTIARLAELKGHDDLLDALADDMKRDPRIKLLWVGDGWLREKLSARINNLNLHKQVITTGLVPPEHIPKYLAAMDVLVHPSYREGLPRTVVQGLLAGLPVIAYDVDGTREVCITNQTGRLIQPGDRAMLREAALWMHDHPVERGGLGKNGRERCRERFSADTMVDHLLRIYEDVLANSR
ncbi:MAG TPA: glycosyltransferase family 4 protein [Phycisphaerales bacterium]|nr:glycosyltransferase family 4 protein [Phycisphaerales bacterium]